MVHLLGKPVNFSFDLYPAASYFPNFPSTLFMPWKLFCCSQYPFHALENILLVISSLLVIRYISLFPDIFSHCPKWVYGLNSTLPSPLGFSGFYSKCCWWVPEINSGNFMSP
ncbi:hypothetical protein L1049_013334 [Liquidambar formosana]|uniref:Uncharacterized protein n=1 Tax=Liquidambar formosana TaxID=63359 RepID=A0AAP0WU00_LIQFO